MQHEHLQFGRGFRVALGNAQSQAAQMSLAPGDVEGGPTNRHKGADQWLFVVSGEGTAVVKRETVRLRPGTLILIQKGETHEIRNTGAEALQTLNVYVPPGYSAEGVELPAGRA